MEFRRWAAISVSAVLALPLSATSSTRQPSTSELKPAPTGTLFPGPATTRMPAPTTAKPSPTSAPLPIGCAPGDSKHRLIGRVPLTGTTRWVDASTLEIGTGVAAFRVRVDNSKLGRPQAVKSGRFTTSFEPPEGDVIEKKVTIVDNQTRRNRTWNGAFFGVAPDRPVMLVASTQPGHLFDFDELSLASGKVVGTYTGFSSAGGTWTASYSDGGRWIVVRSRSQVQVFDTRTRKLISVTRLDAYPLVAFSNNDRWLMLVTSESGTTVLDLSSSVSVKRSKLIASFTNGHGRYVTGSISDDGDVVVPDSCESKVYNLQGALIRTITPSGSVSPSDAFVAVSESNATAVYRTR